MVDEIEIEKALAEDYRRQVQEADARKRKWETYDHAAYVAWIEANPETLKQMAIASGTAENEASAATAVAGFLEDIKRLPALAPFDDIGAYLIMKRLMGEIEQACAALKISTRSGVVFGTAPMFGLQAHQSSVHATNASIIGVSPAFLPFCDLVSKLLAVSLSIDLQKFTVSNDPEQFRARLNGEPDLVLQWARTLLHFAIYGQPPPNLDRPLSIAEGRVRMEMLRAIELFAFGHEYGHHALRHGTPDPIGAADSLTQEQEADFFGQGVAKYVGSTNGDRNFYAISGAGGVSILSALQLVRQIRAVLTTGREEPNTPSSHPPLVERIEAILAVHENESAKSRQAYALMSNYFAQIFEIVWEHLKPGCLRLHARGTRPLPDIVASGGWLPLHS